MTVNEIINEPRQISGELRLKILGLYHQANAGHIGCSLSCIDLMIAILFLNKSEEDTFILSKGHAAAALYACLNVLGEISDEELSTFYQDGTTLPPTLLRANIKEFLLLPVHLVTACRLLPELPMQPR